MNLTDTHAHIYSDQFAKDIDKMLERTFEAEVSRIYMPNIDHTSIDGMLELEEKYPLHCFPMMGLHPCSVDKNFEKELYIAEEWFSRRKFAAVGEMGLDTYWEEAWLSQQQEAFRIQADWAKKYRLPLVIHCRGKEGDGAMKKVIDLLTTLKDENLYGVLHCFGGSLDDAQRLIELGFKLGIGGVVTYKKSGLDEVLKHIDTEHLILETDSPYLAPVPHRGKRNETAYLRIVAQKVADIKQMGLEELAQITTANALAMFKPVK